MNEHALMKFISYDLHTHVRKYHFDKTPTDSYYARKDLADPVPCMNELLTALFQMQDTVEPWIVSVNDCLIYSIVTVETGYYLIGPTLFDNPVHLKHHIQDIVLSEKPDAALIPCDFLKYIRALLLMHNLYQPELLTENQVISLNCIDYRLDENIQKDFSEIIFENNEIGSTHNPYDQEFREQSSIENGDIEQLKQSIAEDYAGKVGILSKDKMRNLKNVSIVVITLASRAAIRGGLAPEIAYSLSDSYIQQIEDVQDVATLGHLARGAEFQYAQMVHELKERQNGRREKEKNPYVIRSKNYIFSHLHDKITVQDIAESLNMNANYLSEVFKKCEGLSLSQYILHEKINRAKNLLIYSRYSFIEIASYLGFSSQSHLGAQFKKITGYTLRQYRNQYGRLEDNRLGTLAVQPPPVDKPEVSA